MHKTIITVFAICVFSGCGTISNVTTSDTIPTHIISKAGFPQQHADNIPLGGIYQDSLVVLFLFNDIACNPWLYKDDFFTAGLLFPFIGVCSAFELTLTATGDAVTLPYTLYKSIFRWKSGK